MAPLDVKSPFFILSVLAVASPQAEAQFLGIPRKENTASTVAITPFTVPYWCAFAYLPYYGRVVCITSPRQAHAIELPAHASESFTVQTQSALYWLSQLCPTSSHSGLFGEVSVEFIAT